VKSTHGPDFANFALRALGCSEINPRSMIFAVRSEIRKNIYKKVPSLRKIHKIAPKLLEFISFQPQLLSLGFGILLLLRWILLAFPMLILWVVGLTERALLGLAIFLDLLSFAGLLRNSLQLHNPQLRPSM
jgi:hypothetical protein